jgi:hypothetical protein
MSHNPSLADLRRFNVRNLRGQGVVTARTDTLAPAMSRTVRAFVPFAVTSEANRGGRLRAKLARKKLVKMAVASALWDQLAGRGQPKRVLLVLLTSKPMDEHDNLRMALKNVVDQIAAMCGFDDSADVWRYSQRRREHYELSGCFVKVEF